MNEAGKKSKKQTSDTDFGALLHIVFQEADIGVLQKAMELDESLQGEIVIIRDDYAVGPIAQLNEAEGWQQRKTWWQELLAISPYEDNTDMVNDRMTVHQLKKTLDETSELNAWIWMGQNQHDVCGYYWLVPQLNNYQGRISVLYLNNLPFINEKGQIYYPKVLHEILPKEFMKAKKLNRLITTSEFEVDPDEWERLMKENGIVRILEGGKKIGSRNANFYDKNILDVITNDWQKGNKLIHNILARMPIKTGDVFLLWRMKKMAEEGVLEINGDPSKGWKEFEVKRKMAAAAEFTNNPE